jgi:tetratricopeptide (TPR) repeat protein
LITGCSAVIQSNAEPPLRRALAAYQRGVARAALGDPSAAIADFGLALSLRPDFAEAAARSGAAYAAKGDGARAIADYSVAIRLNPSFARAYSARADAYFRGGDFDRAIADVSRAIALKPDDAIALNSRCWMRAASGRDLNAALDDCNKAVRLRPGAAGLLDSRGLVYLRLQDYGAAITDYSAALSANPRPNAARASSLYGRGLALGFLGGAAAGRADIDAAVAIAPSIAQFYAKIGLTP